jgi:hypothetical protein
MRRETVRCSLPEAFMAPSTVPTMAQQIPTKAIITMNHLKQVNYSRKLGGADPEQYGSVLIWLFWIRIRIGKADPDPGARKLTKTDKFNFCTYIYAGMFYDILCTYCT